MDNSMPDDIIKYGQLCCAYTKLLNLYKDFNSSNEHDSALRVLSHMREITCEQEALIKKIQARHSAEILPAIKAEF